MNDETSGGGGDMPWYEDLNSPPDRMAPTAPPSGDTPTIAFTPPANPPLGGSPPTAPHFGPPIQGEGPQQSGPTPAGSPVEANAGSGSKKRLVLVGAAVFVALIAIAGGAFIAFGLLRGGGAESPEAAVQTVVDSVNQQDVVLAASVINPDELPMITDLASRLSEARDRLGVGASGTVKGTEVTVEDVDMDVDELTDDVARITVESADVTAGLDDKADEVPSAVRDVVTAFDPTFYTDDENPDDFDGTLPEFTLIAVRSGGGWYLSPSMSALDTALIHSSSADAYEGDFDEVADPGFFDSGAESPEDAVEDLADALASGDPKKVAEQLPSDVGVGVAVYADWIFDSFAESIPGGYNQDGYDVKDLELEVEGGPNGTKKVRVRNLKVSNGEDTFEVDGLEVDDTGGWMSELIDSHWSPSELTNSRGRKAPYFRLIEEAIGDSLYVLTREVDDGWKVDPVATAIGLSSQLMEKVDSGVLDGVTASTDGDPDATLELGKPVAVKLDEYGHANLEAPTEADKQYALLVTTDEVSGYQYGTIRVGDDVFSRGDISYGAESSDPYLFTADGPTRIGLGMFLENPGDVEVTVVEVPVTSHKLGEAITGALADPVEVHTVDGITAENLKASCDDDGVQFAESWAEMSFDMTDDDYCLDSYVVSADDWAKDVQADGRLILVAHGEVGEKYNLLIEENDGGFENGEHEITVTVGSGVTVPFSKPEGDWSIQVDSSTTSDVDGSVSFNGDSYDDDTSTGSVFWLDLPYEGGEGEVELYEYEYDYAYDSPTTATLRLVEE